MHTDHMSKPHMTVYRRAVVERRIVFLKLLLSQHYLQNAEQMALVKFARCTLERALA
jgi:hypothetical protein